MTGARGPHRATTPAQRAELTATAARHYANGMTLRQAAAEIGRPFSTLHEWFTAAGIPRRRATVRVGPTDDGARARLLADLRTRYEAGDTVRNLAADSGYTVSTVRRFLRRAGTQMRPVGRRRGVAGGGR